MKVFADGREVCETPEEWQERRKQVWLRDEKRCVQCGRLLLLLKKADIDHITDRGLAGGTRDDRMENLQTMCWYCHRILKHGD